MQDTNFLIRCYNIAEHFSDVKQTLIDPENAFHEKLSHLSDAFLTPDIISTLERIIRAELHDLDVATVHIIASQTLPILSEISECFYKVSWEKNIVKTAQGYLFAVADRLLFERSTKKVSAREFVLKHRDELNALIKHCSNKKQTLVEFARKHGYQFDGTHLLRAFNEVNLRGAKKGAK